MSPAAWPARNQIPVVQRPAERVDHAGQKQRAIGDAAGQHDVGAAVERFDDRLGTEIRVGGNDLALERRQRRAGFHDGERVAMLQAVLEHVVADHRRGLHRRQTELSNDARGVLGRADRIGSAHAGDHARAVPLAMRQCRTKAILEQLVVSLRWILQPLELRERDRALGQAFVDQVVELAARGKIVGRLDSITGITCAGTDPDRPRQRFLHVVHSSRRCSLLLQRAFEIKRKVRHASVFAGRNTVAARECRRRAAPRA